MKLSSIPQYGTKNPDVVLLQSVLKNRGFDPGPIDGRFGDQTKKAISRFQKSLGLAGSGVIGTKTLAGLGLSVDGSPQLSAAFPKELYNLAEGTPEFNAVAYELLEFDPGMESLIASDCKKVLKGLTRYEQAAAKLGKGMPWWVLGNMHFQESDCDFETVLHNGEPLVDVNRYGTRKVPKGLGKGKNWTWEDSAFHVFGQEKIGKNSDWSDIGLIVYLIELFNGRGYIDGKGKEDVTPYNYSLSNINDDFGKYVADGKYDPKASVQKRSGVATRIKWLERNGYITVPKKGNPRVVVPPSNSPVTPVKPVITRKLIADMVCARMKKMVDLPLRESKGKNRSPEIDKFNKRVGVPMGTPYCASGAWCDYKDVCDELGLKMPLAPTASSQSMRDKVPKKYHKKDGGLKGDSAVFQQRTDPSHGHETILRLDQVPGASKFYTNEYNTGPDGGRDGDGAYAKTRSTSGDFSKKFTVFVDIPQWILDFNQVK